MKDLPRLCFESDKSVIRHLCLWGSVCFNSSICAMLNTQKNECKLREVKGYSSCSWSRDDGIQAIPTCDTAGILIIPLKWNKLNPATTHD